MSWDVEPEGTEPTILFNAIGEHRTLTPDEALGKARRRDNPVTRFPARSPAAWTIARPAVACE